MTIQNENLISTLKLAGLNETEAKIYLANLELGPSSAWNIYLKTKIKRPTCYAVLDNLVADGIATKTNDGNRNIFTVIDPEKLLMSLEVKKNEFFKSLPLFDALKSESKEKPKIRVYEGIEGVFQAYMLGLDQPEGSEILVFGSTKIWAKYNSLIKVYLAERVTKNINIRALYTNSKDKHLYLKMDREELRETKFLPRDYYDPKVETQVFGGTVIYIAHSEKEPFATVIEDESIAFDVRQRFEILWQVSKIK